MSRPGAARLLARVIVFAALSVAISLVFAWAADRLPALAWVVGLAALACGPRSVPYQVMARAPFVQLALLGLRRGELAGLRWDAIDLDAKTIAVAQRTRTTVSVTAKAGQ